MAQKKAHEVDGWLARTDRNASVVLVYGPDRGLVSERARAFARGTGIPLDDPFSVVKLTGDDVERDPARLADEMTTVPMFSERRLVWLRANVPGKAVVEIIRGLAEKPPRDGTLLIEAGDLKKGAGIRAVIESAPSAMALPCYADEGRALDALIDSSLAAAGSTMTLEARQALKQNLGGDRLASRSEIDKLLLYAQGDGEITLKHVEALAGDASGPSLDGAVDAVLLGRIDQFDAAFGRLVASNQVPSLLAGLLRQFQALDALRDQVDSGAKSVAAAVAGAKPPVFFARRAAIETALERWSRTAIRRALERLQAVTLTSRASPALAAALVRQAALGLTVESARSR